MTSLSGARCAAFLVSLSLLFGLLACDWRSPSEKDAAIAESAPSAEEATSPADALAADAADMTMDSETFLEEAAADGLLEVRLGELALRQATSPAIQELAQAVVKDHSAAHEELRGIARDLELEIPVDLPSDKQNTLQHLSELSGADFDREYARTMVDDHRIALETFRQAATHADVAPELQRFAATQIASLQRHHDRARALATTAGTP
jgi:putative membrane protein